MRQLDKEGENACPCPTVCKKENTNMPPMAIAEKSTSTVWMAVVCTILSNTDLLLVRLVQKGMQGLASLYTTSFNIFFVPSIHSISIWGKVYIYIEVYIYQFTEKHCHNISVYLTREGKLVKVQRERMYLLSKWASFL